jgi:hypothetical protein
MRGYAHALMMEAYNLDKDIFPKEENQSQDGFYIKSYTDWQDMLIGKSFSCTYVLSNMMGSYIKKNYDENIICQTIPADWL